MCLKCALCCCNVEWFAKSESSASYYHTEGGPSGGYAYVLEGSGDPTVRLPFHFPFPSPTWMKKQYRIQIIPHRDTMDVIPYMDFSPQPYKPYTMDYYTSSDRQCSIPIPHQLWSSACHHLLVGFSHQLFSDGTPIVAWLAQSSRGRSNDHRSPFNSGSTNPSIHSIQIGWDRIGWND